ncbi:hypothetical protein D3C80_1415540 [compost metagenome]
MTDHCDSAAGGDLEIHVMQDLPTRVVAKLHHLEVYLRLAGDQLSGIGSILHVLALVQQAKQALHVGQRLLHFPVHHAKQEQWRGKLQQIGIDQDQIPNRQGAGDYPVGG